MSLANFVYFTIPKISTYLNSSGVEKKKPIGMPKDWTTVITADNYKQFINSSHKAFCLPTGKINDITVIDFDDKDAYNLALEKFPDLANYKTIQTKRGYHIYCKYNPDIHTTTDGLSNYKGVDIASDGHMVFAPPTSYIGLDDNVNRYVDLGGEILDIPEFIIQDLKSKHPMKQLPKTVFKPITPPPSPISVTQVPQDEEDKFLDLLNNVIKNEVVAGVKQITWDYWFQICGILKHNGYAKTVWLNYSSKCFPNTSEASVLWDGIKNQSNMNIHGFQNIAKYINPNGYKNWLKKWSIYGITFNEVNEPYACANKIYNTLGETLKLCNEKWYMLTNNQLWKKQNEPTKFIISEIHKYLDFEKDKLNSMSSSATGEEKKALITKLEEWIKLYYVITKSGYLSVLTKILKSLLVDDEFEKKLDNNKGKLAFRNGIMDLETKVFRSGIMWDDYITETIPYDYVPSNYDFIKPVLLKILNNNEEHLNYYLSIIGYSFIGDANLEKSLYFMIDKTEDGKGDNGKTFFFDILNDLLPNYVYKSKSTFILKKNTKSHKQLAEMKGKRLVWLEELPKDETNAELMKEIADGKTTENEVMFGTSEIINIMFKMFVLSNNIPNITADEEAVYNRFKQVSFNSHFDRTGERLEDNPAKLEFIADVKLSNTIKENYSNEVFNLIIDYAHKYYKNGLPKIPQQFIKDTSDTKKNNDKFGKWFFENCEKDEDGKVALKLLAVMTKVSEEKVKESMKKLGYKYDKELKGIGKDDKGKYYKGGFKGVKMIDEDEEEEE